MAFKVWVQLIFLASEHERETLVDNARVKLKRGELEASIADLAAHAGTTPATYKRALATLQDVEFIKLSKGGAKRSRIYVLNYDTYQDSVANDTSPEPAPEPPKPKPRRGPSTDLSAMAARADAYLTEIETRVKRDVAAGKTAEMARRLAVIDVWNAGDDPAEFIGLYDILFARTFDFRDMSLVASTKKQIGAHVPIIRARLKTFAETFGGETWARPMLAAYTHWVFEREAQKTAYVAEIGGDSRKPITMEAWLSTEMMARWQASRKLAREKKRRNGRGNRQGRRRL
jgi:hypothetical protein